MDSKKRVFTVLCIDGGGVRGLIPARILEEIENRTGKPIAELFDMIGGPSTGSIVAAGLAAPDPADPSKPRHTAKQMKEFYYRDAPKIFPEITFKSLRQLAAGALYDPKPLEDALKANLGDTKMSDSLTHLMIPATDIKNFRPVWISHFKGQKDASPEGWNSMLMRDAVRASTTAPTYFPARYYQTTPNEDMPNITHRHALIDGGFFAGNVMRRMMTQAKKLAPPDAEIVLVHVGTGSTDNSLSPEEFNKLGPLGMVNKSNGSILMSLVINISGVDAAEDMQDEIGDRFISFDGKIPLPEGPKAPSSAMDDAKPDNLKHLEKFAENIIRDNNAEMERLCNILKTRTFTEFQHQQSTRAFQTLAEKLKKADTVKSLTMLYTKILQAAGGINIKPADKEDAEIFALAQRLTEPHKIELDRLYNVLQDKLENRNRLINAIKEAGDDITHFFKKNLGGHHDAEPPKSDNDNNKPPANAADPAAPPQKKKFWPRLGR